MGAINKAFEILDLFLNKLEPMGVSEVAELTHLNPTTAYRIITALVRSNYLEQIKKRGKYAINTKKLMAFSSVITPSLKIRNIALPFLHELSTMIQETTQIAIPLGNVAFKDDFLYSANILNVRPSRERIIDLYSTGTGKIFLAEMSDSEFAEYCRNIIIRPLTPNTITDLTKLKKHLGRIKKEAISYDLEEHELGIISVAAPIKDAAGNVVAAVSIIAPSIRLANIKKADTTITLKEFAGKISKSIK
ncbi:MAG: IclR family transcriptional regulator [Dehalococcoidia bacterium]|nr:MAG: IclR family transcriptional regulator [Dehalococcoidia bacterium]